jgi:NADPH:quinone reductase-like Zn-dependent oxidoreductase
MNAVVTTGNGDLDRLVYRDVPRPEPRDGEVLVEVRAAGVNNTDVNARVGWDAPSEASATAGRSAERDPAAAEAGTAAEPGAAPGTAAEPVQGGGWNGTTPWPLIQGTDACGRVAATGVGTDPGLLGRRVLVRPDGAFAQYVRVPASEVFPVEAAWTDVELGSVPCAFGTAENLLQRAGVTADDHVVVTGASGGVGSAAVQLAAPRVARGTAVAGVRKSDQILALGAARGGP